MSKSLLLRIVGIFAFATAGAWLGDAMGDLLMAPLLLTVLFLMAVQATFFSPAKYGIIPPR